MLNFINYRKTKKMLCVKCGDPLIGSSCYRCLAEEESKTKESNEHVTTKREKITSDDGNEIVFVFDKQ